MTPICPWEDPVYGLLSSNVPLLLPYSHVIGILAALVSSLLLLKSRQQFFAKGFVLMSGLFTLWTLIDWRIWATNKTGEVMFLWSTQILLEVLIYAIAVYLVYRFSKEAEPPISAKILSSILILPVTIALPTKYLLKGIDRVYCNAIEYPFIIYYSYALELLAILVIVRITAARIEAAGKGRGAPTLFFGAGIITFLLAFTSGNIIGSLSENWDIAQYGLFGMPVFIGILTYTIIKFKTFNLKIFATQALVWALWIMIGGILLIAQTDATRIVTAITEIIAIIFGIMLIKSVRREVEQREQLATLNAELGDKNTQLTDLNRQKNEFLRVASHDLKSPVGLIKQWATLIDDGTYKEPTKVHETLEKIKMTADRSIQSVDDILDVNKIDEGRMDYTFEVRDIVPFVKGITEDYAPLAKVQKNIVVTFESPVKSANVKMDTTRLRQVIQNLMSNSFKYSEKGWIKVILTEEQKSVLIAVKDSGLGMSKELLPILFEQFRRDPSVAKKIQGTGLGLYISKLFTVAHGGEIWAESEGKGMGSTFFVRLPKA